jgi:MYXO-CTERM domain-containing protein
MKTRNALAMIALVAGVAIPALPAAAYVRTRTTAGVATAWSAPCVTMEFSLGDPPLQLDAAAYLSAAQRAGQAWSSASLDGLNRCSNVAFTVVALPDVAGKVGMDYQNRLIFRKNAWCRDPPPTDPNESPCYETGALAITTVFQLKSTGEILDADLEVNATNYTWGDYADHKEQFVVGGVHDFQGAITHEFGHVIGLEHTCFVPGQLRTDGTLVPRPVDNNGTPVPDCDSPSSPASVTQATMYVSVKNPADEEALRSLSPDDVQGACDIYPFNPNFVCVSPSRAKSQGGCSCAYTATTGLGPIAFVLGLLALAVVRRRR